MVNYPKNVLAIHAHPDDSFANCAGVLKLLRDKGWNVFIATLTGGGLGSVSLSQCRAIMTRKEEAIEAASLLDADYYCFNQDDGFLFDNEKIRMEVTEYIRAINPGIVLTHLPYNYHSDHRMTSTVVQTATMLSTYPNLRTKEPPLEIAPILYHTAPRIMADAIGRPFPDPHFYIDITSVMNKKMELISKHETQLEVMRQMHHLENYFSDVKAYSAEQGEKCGVHFAEGFWQNRSEGFTAFPLLQESLKEFVAVTEIPKEK